MGLQPTVLYSSPSPMFQDPQWVSETTTVLGSRTLAFPAHAHPSRPHHYCCTSGPNQDDSNASTGTPWQLISGWWWLLSDYTQGNAHEGTQKWNLFIKNCVFIPTCLNFSLLQSALYLMHYTYQDFLPLLRTVSNSSILKPFRASAFFLFYFFHIGKNIFLWGQFLSGGNQKKVTRVEIGRIGRAGLQGHAVVGQTLLNTQRCVGRCAHKSPIMKRANALKESSEKYSLKLNTASHNTSWYTGTGGFLDHSRSRGSLYYKGPTSRS